VDVAHDLGAMGPGGGGALGTQGLLGKVDLVMGSFSKTFASNGGFLAARSPAAKQFAKYFGNPHMFSNALSPVQAGVVSEAIRIVRSPEGDVLRERLLASVNALRDGFASHGVTCYGSPSAIVPVPFRNDRLARLASRRIAESGVFINLVEYPAVPIGEARLRMQVMAPTSRRRRGRPWNTSWRPGRLPKRIWLNGRPRRRLLHLDKPTSRQSVSTAAFRQRIVPGDGIVTIWSYRAGADRNETVQAIALLANLGVVPTGSSIPAWKVDANTLDDSPAG
jgi:Aminotransferase class I and II